MKPTRPLHEIAADISQHWVNPPRYAQPYITALSQMESIDHNYGFDAGHMIVRYFLANAQSFRGEHARRIKKELNEMLK